MFKFDIEEVADVEDALLSLCYTLSCGRFSCDDCPLSSPQKLVTTLNEIESNTNKI